LSRPDDLKFKHFQSFEHLPLRGVVRELYHLFCECFHYSRTGNRSKLRHPRPPQTS
jgi:hypothetical protein